jgi:hypothetical protein
MTRFAFQVYPKIPTCALAVCVLRLPQVPYLSEVTPNSMFCRLVVCVIAIGLSCVPYSPHCCMCCTCVPTYILIALLHLFVG